MRTKTLLFFLVALSLKSLMAADVILNNFESSTPTVTASYGATIANVANPNTTGYNTTANCAKVGRTGASWYALIQFPVSFTLPASTDQYIHILVNYLAQPDISIRINGTLDIRPTSFYTNFGQWQDLVVKVNGGTSGFTCTNLMILTDIGYNSTPAGQVLNNTDKFGYLDEIIINDNPTPRSSTSTALNSSVINSKIYSLNGAINIESIAAATLVTVYNNCGQLVASKEIDKKGTISIKNKGFYFVNIGNKTTKILVK